MELAIKYLNSITADNPEGTQEYRQEYLAELEVRNRKSQDFARFKALECRKQVCGNCQCNWLEEA